MRTPSRRQALTGGAALVAAGALGSFGELSRRTRTDDESSSTDNEILALGDSYTIGTSVDPDERWTSGLVEQLRGNGFAVSSPEIIAKAGWTTADLEAGIQAEGIEGTYDLVTLCIGANNAFQGEEPAEFRPAFVSLLDRSVGFAGGDASNVIVMTIPDYSLTPVGQQHSPTATAERLESYNRLLREEVAKAGTRLVDLVPASRNVAKDPELVSDDGLHPSPKQHDLWLDRILPVAITALE